MGPNKVKILAILVVAIFGILLLLSNPQAISLNGSTDKLTYENGDTMVFTFMINTEADEVFGFDGVEVEITGPDGPVSWEPYGCVLDTSGAPYGSGYGYMAGSGWDDWSDVSGGFGYSEYAGQGKPIWTGYGYGYDEIYQNGYGPIGSGTLMLWCYTPINEAFNAGDYTAILHAYTTSRIDITDTVNFKVESNYYITDVDIGAGENETIGNPDAGFELDIYTDSGYSGTIEVNTSTGIPAGVSGYSLEPTGTWLEFNAPELGAGDWAIIKVYYTDAQLAIVGIDESTLRIQYYNATSDTWETYNPPRGGVNTIENYVWANVTHFSGFGVFGVPVVQQGSGGSGGSGGLPSTGQNSTWTDDTLTSAMAVRDFISFTLGTESHTIKLISLGGDYALLNISSPDPDTVTVHVGETKEADVNKDGTNDISIMLSKIELGKAYLEFAKLTQPATQPPATQPPAAEQPPATQPPATQPPITQPAVTDNTAIIIVAALIIIAVIVAWLYKGKMK